MNTFLELNRKKVKFIFHRLALALSGFVLIVLIIAYLTENFPNGRLLFLIILATVIGFPVFIMLVGYIVWLFNHRARLKVFAKTPFDQVETIGFYKSFVGDCSKWSFTELIKECKLNNFTLRMDVSKEKSHTIEFDTPVEWKKLTKSEYSCLTEKFKQHNIEFRVGSIAKQYDTKQFAFQTVFNLNQDLELFTMLLKQEGFQPKA